MQASFHFDQVQSCLTHKRTNLVLFALTAPLELYGTLQRLNLVSEPLFPHPRACLSWLLASLSGERWLRYPNLLILQSFLYIWVLRNNSVGPKMCDYFWATLPKPTRPDKFSLIGAQADGYDSSNIAGLSAQNNIRYRWTSKAVTDRMALGFRFFGSNWQTLYDRCAQALSWSHPITTDPDLAAFIRRDEALDNNLRAELSTDQSHTYVPEPSTTTTIPGLYGQESLHNPSDHTSLPVQTASTVRPTPETPGHLISSDSSSPPSSLPASPRQIELRSHNENGEVYVNLTLPAPPDLTRRRTMSDGTRRGPPMAALTHIAAPPEGSPWITESMEVERSLRLHEPIAGSDRVYGPRHRVTALSAHAADSMAQRLSSLFMSTLCLQSESLFVRSVAFAFLSTPSQSSASGAAAVSRMSNIYDLKTWFGPGLNAGGWKGAWDYGGKIMLVQVLEAGVGVVTWQLGMGLVWWAGRTWCGWNIHNPADSVGKSRKALPQEGSEPWGEIEVE